MTILPIRIYPDPVLKQKSKPLTLFGGEEQKFFDDMVETMFQADGVGLAAPQVGILQRVIVVTPVAKRGQEMIMVNPVIVEKSGTQLSEEGCLSFPGIIAEVIRSVKIVVRYQDRHGKDREIKAAELLSRAIQHELDHLDGVLLIDRVEFNKRQTILDEIQAMPKSPKKITRNR